MGSDTASGAEDTKASDTVKVIADLDSVQQYSQFEHEHRKRIFGVALPNYFNIDADRTLVRKLDIFVLYA